MINLEAVIEIGSTGIRLMAFELASKKSWKIIDKSECPIPLGYDVFTTGYLSRDTILQTLNIQIIQCRYTRSKNIQRKYANSIDK